MTSERLSNLSADEPTVVPNPESVQTKINATESEGLEIGPYKLLQKVGEGGMGVVWMAQQQHPVRRTVALKIIKAGMDTGEVIARFEAERQALALMNHENIARVLDGGATSSGRPYFVMELVKGLRITDYCDSKKLSAEDRMKLFVSVCAAVQHAHQKGVIHRDIKPSNVLVAIQDDQPVVKVIDFGLAKATAQRLTEKTLFTAMGQMVGTPAYMSPEQAGTDELDIDTRTDVYSLGVLLYELLTGVTPLDVQRLRSAGYAEIQRLIQEEDPPAMSVRLSSLGADSSVAAEKRATDPRRLASLLSGDANVVVMKALDKDRSRRYATPNDFAADVRRYLRQETVEARPPSFGYRLDRLIRRNKAVVFTTAVITLTLVVATGVSTWQAYQTSLALNAERAANEIATKRLGQLKKNNLVLGAIFRDLDPLQEESGGQPLLAQLIERLDDAAEILDEDAVGDPLAVADLQLTLGVTQRRLGRYEQARELLTKALATREAALGPDHLDTVASVFAMSEVEASSGNLPEAKALCERALKVRKAELGEDHEDTLLCLSKLAFLHHAQGDRDRGLELQEQAYEAMLRVLGPNHYSTIQTLNSLATQNYYYNDAEHDEKAEELYEEVRRRFIKTRGPDHHSTLTASHSLASVNLTLGNYDRAIELYEQVLAGFRSKVGPDHIATLRAGNALAVAWDRAGESEKGLKLLAEGVAKIRQLLGDDDPRTMDWLNTLAYTYEQNDQLEPAIKIHSETLQLRENKFGAGHPLALTSRSNLAWCLQRSERYTESVNHYRLAVAGFRALHGPAHAETIGCTNNFTQSLVLAKQFDEALPILQENVPLMEDRYPDLWKTHRAKTWLGIALLSQDNYDEAEPHLRSGLDALQEREDNMSAEGRSAITTAMEQLVQLYSQRNAAGDAEAAAKLTTALEKRNEEQTAL
jgi:eukaryotic-like serine/threonine-protein kinase